MFDGRPRPSPALAGTLSPLVVELLTDLVENRLGVIGRGDTGLQLDREDRIALRGLERAREELRRFGALAAETSA